MNNIERINDLEYLLYHANKKVDELKRPYEVDIDGVVEVVSTLAEMKKALDNYEKPVRVKMKKLRRRK